jgi:hypothetical protein
MTASATISLDHECWDHKPSATLQYKDEKDKYGNPRTEVRVLGTRLGIDTEEVTPRQLARAIMRGQTWSPFVFHTCPDWKRRRRMEGLFAGCQVLGVDYDAGESLESIMSRAAEAGIGFNIIHHSFSSTPAHPKFRGIIFLREEITEVVQAKVLSTALAYGLDGDKACVDLARLYFGSTADSVVHLDAEATTPILTLEALAERVQAEQYVVPRTAIPKENDPDWGDITDQRRIWAGLTPGKREFVKRKILGILREIESFDGANGGSRYECVWKKTSRIARMPETVGNVVREWVLERIEANPYFADWDKDADSVVRNAITWSFDHAEPPV